MPLAQPPNPISPVDLESLPFKFSPQPMDDAYALTVARNTFLQFMGWRSQHLESRWEYSERLWFGSVRQRYWEGTKIPRASVPMQKVFQFTAAAYSTISQELFGADDLLRVIPEGDTSNKIAQKIEKRLKYILEHNLDDYGWNASMEYKQALRDLLIYGNGYGLVEYDYARRQPVLIRIDPRDVYIDPATTSPYVEKSRHSIVRRYVTVADVEGWRDAPGFTIPPREIVYWLARNKVQYWKNAWTENMVQDPTGQLLNLFVHMFSGREVWTLENQVVIYNQAFPYKCSRLVGAPCFEVPNRHYGMSLTDVLDPIQQAATTLLNQHLDGRSLALSPPRTVKAGQTRTPSALSWRPNGLYETNGDPKNEMIVHNPEGLSSDVWQDLGFLDQEAQKTVGISSLVLAGMPGPSNANRTQGGMQMQLAGSNSRLAPIAENFEKYFMIPSFYKMLKVDATHASAEGGNGGY